MAALAPPLDAAPGQPGAPRRSSWRAWLASWLTRRPAAPSPDALADDGAVAYSACRVAARRALEASEPDPIAVDPLAAALAGPRALADATATRAPRPAGRRRRPVDRIAVRTRWFDDEVVHALIAGGAPAVRAAVMVLTATGRVAVALAPPPPAPGPPRQVLVAGAGMDARAWRLPLPSGTAWYEVDAVGVLRAKARALAGGAGAGGVPTAVTTRDGAVPVASGGALARRGPPRHPLKAASLSFVAADLASPGWSAPLVAAGFDPAAPSVTVAEGLVMYLPGEAGAASFLRELAAVAAPGSVLLLVAVTAATAAAARARANGAGLMAAWTFGCDPDPAPLLAACGWRVVGVDTRSDMARRYAAPGREWGFPVRPASSVRAERESLFVVAVRGVSRMVRVGGGRG